MHPACQGRREARGEIDERVNRERSLVFYFTLQTCYSEANDNRNEADNYNSHCDRSLTA